MNRKELLLIEKNLSQKFKDKRENEVILEHNDFKDGKLSLFGYVHLKQQCEYIEYDQDIEITVPKEYIGSFKPTLESMTDAELRQIKKDRSEAKILSLIFLFMGVSWYILSQLVFPFESVLREITVIVTWVFVWTAVEKFFFDRNKLRDRRFSLLQILAAKLKASE